MNVPNGSLSECPRNSRLNLESQGCAFSPLRSRAYTLPHFPDALHAVVWRNWDGVDIQSLAAVFEGTPEQLTEPARSMGLPPQRSIPPGELRRNSFSSASTRWPISKETAIELKSKSAWNGCCKVSPRGSPPVGRSSSTIRNFPFNRKPKRSFIPERTSRGA